jgi:hypothetical protein
LLTATSGLNKPKQTVDSNLSVLQEAENRAEYLKQQRERQAEDELREEQRWNNLTPQQQHKEMIMKENTRAKQSEAAGR